MEGAFRVELTEAQINNAIAVALAESFTAERRGGDGSRVCSPKPTPPSRPRRRAGHDPDMARLVAEEPNG